MAVIRPNAEPAATTVAAGDIFLIDGATGVRALAATSVAFTNTANTFTGTQTVPALVATTINGNTITTGTGVLTLGAGKTLTASNSLGLAGVDGKTLTVSNSLALAGTDGTTQTFPSTSATLARTDAGQTFTGTNAFGVLTATTINGNTFTPGTGILTIAAAKTLTVSNSLTLAGVDGKTLTVSNSLTLAGTDGTTQTFPATSGTVVTSVSSNAVTNAMAAQTGAATLKGNPTGVLANVSDFTIQGLTNLASPSGTLDFIPIYDHVSGTIKNVTPSAITSSAVAGVSSFNGATGAITLLSPPQGRLTLTSGTAVMTSNVAGATTLYYTPSSGRFVPIWNGTQFVMVDIEGELSQATTDATKSPAAVAASQVYDIFVWSDGGTIRATRGPAWSAGTGGSNTVRGTGAGSAALSLVNGILVNANAITNGPAANFGTYIGTVMSDANSQLNMVFGGASIGGTAAVLGVWNAYNRVSVNAKVQDTTTSWTYTGQTPHAVNASNNNRVTFVTGLALDTINALYSTGGTNAATAGAYFLAGFKLDATNDIDREGGGASAAAYATSFWAQAAGFYSPQLGQHFIQAVERTDGSTATFIGQQTGINRQQLEVSLPM